jgi:hypothetical protein
MRERSGSVRRPWEVESYDRLFRRLLSELAREDLDRMRAEGRNLTTDQTVELVRRIAGVA